MAQLIPASHLLLHVMAQSAVTTTTQAPTPTLSENNKAALAALGLIEQEKLCRKWIALKVTDATLDELVQQAQTAAVTKTVIEVREALPARFTFDLTGTSLGSVLDSAAHLAGCKLYVLSDRLVIAPSWPSKKFSAEEQEYGDEWARESFSSKGEFQFKKVALKTVIADLSQLLDEKMKRGENLNLDPAESTITSANAQNWRSVRFGELSPELQQILQMRVVMEQDDISSRGMNIPIVKLTDQAIVSLDDSNPKFWTLSVRGQQGRPHLHWNFAR